jgi:hypothetical protein
MRISIVHREEGSASPILIKPLTSMCFKHIGSVCLYHRPHMYLHQEMQCIASESKSWWSVDRSAASNCPIPTAF